ncbi:tRNA uracil 4-sulfurtransferase ThiI [Dellaglioa algida]|uniref:Probable tRNA sulfurtransferase n=1 Tax=Dellaglioa algida TaxID=105612 RepID=A0A5C6M770_9LACO|nr:tRNA uracil 4-sulfurtransferase ThiI [Dellaglioa algida]MDK1717426.1 tRNA 4-thiouridine(8) synthase ThiI [Dellaglioa algida]MDK1720699.1 tRNA 4-thiouridine(8) synthase ThiI [Dellaglioa algida]MDK1722368.1 tRNA 4-thiouridine(8) synthase ThiI [Dellaglioa algida]MDK1723992.1 tRNA 4-thiouridine(8) synthase ThiI [Dellaglioa algida]MDK1725573.1 tRNA 4-thiouridine(8) synthase ThiI [Dellaglioa algida]
MQYTEIMVRYGELSTKGKNKRNFIDRLGTNVRNSLRGFDDLVVKANRDRMHINLNGDDSELVMQRLSQVFGIQNFSPAIRVEQDLDAVKETAVAMVSEQFVEGTTFKVNTRRSDHDFELDTNEMNDELGGWILDHVPGITVKMKQPDIILRVEVRANGIFLSSETRQGAGGLPVGTAGKGMLMLSGGIDSPVAGYLGMKRGVSMEMVHFFSPPYTSEQALAKAKELTVKLTPYVGTIQFIEVPFTEIQEQIKHDVPEPYLMTITRRFMLRLTEKIAELRGGLAIFNGESLGQVASQTLESMVAINDVTTMPIIRPVVSMDKNEIIDVAKKIDTFDLSIKPFEDCCTIFAPPAPKTKPRLDRSREFEARLDIDGLIERALAGVKVTKIHIGEEYLNENSSLFAELL